jgi:hypothetical protein
MAVMEDHGVRVGLSATRISSRAIALLVDALEPSAVPLCDVTDMWIQFDLIERLAAGAKTLLAARVAESGCWKRAGARSTADHLARLGGTSARAACRTLENSKELSELPGVAAALRAGELSQLQAEVIVPAAAADPSSEHDLLGLAGTTSVSELRAACLRAKAKADPDPDATHRRIHEARHARTFSDAEGAWNLHVRGTAEQGARFESALKPIIDAMFQSARADGRKEPREAYAFDALMHLANRDEPSTGSPQTPKPRFLALLHVDFEALVRGAADGEETCEIVGIGPVPVRVARDLLGDAIVKLVITKGVDVANVTHLGRGPTAAQRIALLWSKPKCANSSCSSMFVQIDHREPWARTKHTKLDELDPLCPHDHKLKTNQGWSLVAGNGRRAFVSPEDPRHPRNKPPP